MKTLLAIVLVMFTTTVSAENWRDPTALFDARKLEVNKSLITWVRDDNVQARCESESRKRVNKGFGYAMTACSFWDNNTCTIITGKRTTMHDLGHEMRHCFQGSFH
jgi:hypothetical protein